MHTHPKCTNANVMSPAPATPWMWSHPLQNTQAPRSSIAGPAQQRCTGRPACRAWRSLCCAARTPTPPAPGGTPPCGDTRVTLRMPEPRLVGTAPGRLVRHGGVEVVSAVCAGVQRGQRPVEVRRVCLLVQGRRVGVVRRQRVHLPREGGSALLEVGPPRGSAHQRPGASAQVFPHGWALRRLRRRAVNGAPHGLEHVRAGSARHL
jgi:hypothetical protein